jgi:hypothetical protein
VLRFEAAVMGLAAVAVFLPTDWMAGLNDRLGLEPLPRSPLVEYLTRSLSALYAAYGSLMWVTASDVERYAGVISYMGWAAVAFGGVLAGIDLAAGMPAWWTALDAASPACGGALVLLLQRRARG